jgi:hypothetical protein
VLDVLEVGLIVPPVAIVGVEAELLKREHLPGPWALAQQVVGLLDQPNLLPGFHVAIPCEGAARAQV